MKKEIARIFSVLFVISILFSVSLISAQNIIQTFYDTVGPGIESIFAPIFGGDTSGEFLWAKILLFFLLFSVIYMVLNRIPTFSDNIVVCVVLSTIVAILSVRYLQPNQFITAILLPYGGLGAAITVFLPFVIFFWFLHSADIGSIGRRTGWALYGAALAFLLISRWGDLTVPDTNGNGFNAQWVYLFALILVAIAFFWDRPIHNQIENQHFVAATDEVHQRGAQEWLRQLRLAEENGDMGRARAIRARLRRYYGR